MFVFDGSTDVCILSNYLKLTLKKDYFFEAESSCFCIPICISCTDTAGDVWQNCEINDQFNKLSVGLDCDSCPFDAIIYIPKSESFEVGKNRIIVQTGVSVCGKSYPGMVEIMIDSLSIPADDDNLANAEKCYSALNFFVLWDKLRRNCFIPESGLIDIFKSCLRENGGEFFDNYENQYLFLWEENSYRAISTRHNATVELEIVMRCISSIISEDLEDSSSFVYSLIVSPIAAEYNFTMETKEAVWSMPSVSVKTRFLLHCFEIESTFMDHGKIMLVEFGLDNTRVYILLDGFPNNLVTDCLFHSDECTPWDE